ncbi:phosphotransferase enzyme family protein [Bacillus sp. JCM 19045]|nr:phosphotransferase enzyme family protein [Bacillus sp. JCM 19045]
MGDPRADVCRSYLLYQNVSARFAEHYLALYCEGSGTPKSVILQWEPIIAGARLAEGISDNERERLLQIVHRITD